MAKNVSRFFTTKTVCGDVRCSIRGEQACTIWFDKIDKKFCVCFVRPGKSLCVQFDTFQQADLYAYANWA